MNDYNERDNNERDNNDIDSNDYGSFSGDVPLITGYNIRKLFIENKELSNQVDKKLGY